VYSATLRAIPAIVASDVRSPKPRLPIDRSDDGSITAASVKRLSKAHSPFDVIPSQDVTI
jgi:hypothetical protein